MLSKENLMGWGNLTGMLRYGDRWRFQRKLTHEAFHKNANKALRPLVERQTHLILQGLLVNSDQFSEKIKRILGETVLMAVYGYDAASVDDSLFSTVDTAVRSVSEALVVQNFLVNAFPWLDYVPEWFPGATWKIKANEWRRQRDLMLHVPFEWTRGKMSIGADVHSMLSSWLDKYAHIQPTDSNSSVAELEDQIRWAAGTVFFAAIDTTVSSIRTFIMAMAMYPSIQAKAQAEIDRIIGTRLPELADQEVLKYVECVVKETLRWRLIKPLAAPHACIQDDTYKGYHIPKGAIVIGNTWAISNNPDVYPNPDCFDPDRFLDPSVPEAPAFGFGRRICPGAHHAKSVLFITAASILSVFDIRPEVDADGKSIPLNTQQKMNGAVW
ncbi:O-methylsterigmatocystin oxidoreductase OS=Aspergillus flavus GN=ordA PE=3 SV=2 [Rhizoctonia solani AG-1 IB]|uniref:O-methylsterigmatocystin oxidoreductase n=1 Tax=Thanatephorus cucumeris (strain AG1-IB / isolate 7/3/14) TaxID=1108050 RepID=A0A0B7FJF8_THACB|nr:O-methylsterigmatocystin oxidoreductase OS=Aspergillus flavus GN=ordA PE=3 SV=2 [Rhizoctonia solani AG-1 IB]